MLIYVDDILLIGDLENTITELNKEFNANDLGGIKHFLGMEIARNKEPLIIKHSKLIERILEKFNMKECKRVLTPIETNLQLKESKNIISVPYRELVGSLMYLTVTSRPDLTYTVSFLSRYLDKPSEQKWKAGKRVLRYLKETKDIGLIFRKSTDSTLYAYSDADWAGDKNDRKRVSGSIIFYGENPIAWLSKKQNCVALSSAESEYFAAALTAQELVNLIGIRNNLRQSDKAVLLVDNQGAISIAKNHDNSKRTQTHRH